MKIHIKTPSLYQYLASPWNISAEADYSHAKPAWILASRAVNLDIFLEEFLENSH